MRQLFQLALFTGFLSLSTAVFKDEVGVSDFHHALVGLPQIETTFFHRPQKDEKASLIYTLSDLGVVAAINPGNGDIVWRQQVSQHMTQGGGSLRAPEGEDWVAAGYGSKVQSWSALNGRSVWNLEFPGQVKDLEIMELTETARKDVLVLFQEDSGTVLRRLDSSSGMVIWEFRETSSDVPLQVSSNIANVHIVSLHGSPSSYSLRSTSLDPITGARVDHVNIGGKGTIYGPKNVQSAGVNSVAPLLAWTSPKMDQLSVYVLGGKAKPIEISLLPDTQEVFIHAPHSTNAQPHFLVHMRTTKGNKGEVFHTDLKTGRIEPAYELPYLPGRGAFSTSVQDANVFFTRITAEDVLVTSSESHGVLAAFRLASKSPIEPAHVVSEVVTKVDGGYAVRSAVLDSQGDWQMVKNGEPSWTRPEGLSGVVAAVYADIPESENLAKVLEAEAHTNPVSAYIHRVQRHFDDLKYLPSWLLSLPFNLAQSVVSDSSAKTQPLTRDVFGFNKMVVLLTCRGRAFGLDTGNFGQVAWSTQAFSLTEGEKFDVKGALYDAETGLVQVRGPKAEYVAIKAIDGQVVESRAAGTIAVASTAVVDGKSFVAFDANGKPVDTIFGASAPDETIVLRDGEEGIRGIRFVKSGDQVVEEELWRFQALPGRKIVNIASLASHDPVSSIGRVLGDRKVLYKYLNPNSIVIAVYDARASTLSVQLIDTLSGQLLASQSYAGVDGDKTVSCAMSDNWYACTFFGQYTLNDATDRAIKGYQVVASDLYESSIPDDRGSLGDTTHFSTLEPVNSPTGGVPLPHVVTQAWVLSQPLSDLTVTQTRQGITNRNILAYLPSSHSVVALPRQLVDPRRPVGRDPTAAEMEAEGLIKYLPSIEIDSRNFVSHELDVLGIHGILASPAIVESTSLMVAYGIDIFGTRVAPSGVFDILGKSFNKLTMLATVVALFGGVVFLAPMVRRKQINRGWEGPS